MGVLHKTHAAMLSIIPHGSQQAKWRHGKNTTFFFVDQQMVQEVFVEEEESASVESSVEDSVADSDASDASGEERIIIRKCS